MKRASSVGDLRTAETSNNKANTGTKRPRKAARSKGPSSPALSQLSNRPSEFSSPSSHAATDHPSSVQVNDEIQKLKLEVIAQKQTISMLMTKISFVLSFLGIDDLNSPNNVLSHADIDTIGGPVDADNELCSSIEPAVVPTATSQWSFQQATGKKAKSYSDAARSKLVDSMKSDLLSAVHAELDLKTKRSNNVVIQGLPSASGPSGSDIDHVKDFLNVEFGAADRPLKVVSCRRLGRRKVTESAVVSASASAGAVGRTFQPLLVSLETSQQARYIIDNAKKLRNSICEYTRGHIYINSDMTAAESKAAYDLRCRRREKMAARASAVGAADAGGGRGAATATADGVITAALTDVCNNRTTSSTASSSTTASQPNSRSSLDPAVQPFQPGSSVGTPGGTGDAMSLSSQT